jgi:hypothetical protein
MTVATSKTESAEQVTMRMQAAVNAWHGGLWASGGALKPDKCSWGLVSFGWDQGNWFYLSVASQPGTLTIPVPNGNPVTITRHEPSEGIKVMGVMQALDGNMTAQLDTLCAKATQWGTQIKEGWNPRHLARNALDTMIWPSLKYPLPASNLSE